MNRALAMALALGSAACGREASTDRAATQSPSQDTASALDSALAQDTASIPESFFLAADSATPVGFQRSWSGDLGGMIERRYIRVLVTPSRTSYFNEMGRPYGISYEAVRAFEEQLNRRLKLGARRVRMMFIPVSRDRLLTGVRDGLGDLAVAQITVTPERRAMVDFSEPTATGVKEIVVTGAVGPELDGVDALSGREVFIRRSSSYWEHAEALNRELTARGKAPVKLREVPEELDDEDILEMVNAGLVPATIVDEYLARLWARVLPNIRPQPASATSTDGAFAWAFRKGSPKLEAEVNAFVRTHRKGTLFGNTVIRRYTGSTRFVATAAETTERKKFEEMIGLFRRYAEKYELDALLMMAQGFQESRLNQAAVSPVGAIGVMQVMPATGRQMNVGDIRQLEPNIHAGTKYMHHLMEVYFPNEPKDLVNRTLLTFASYNAGPNRIRRLRQETAARGLDRNLWFDNVEVLAAEAIGSETVTYVSNIFKYYVAYRLMLQEQEAREAARAKVR